MGAKLKKLAIIGRPNVGKSTFFNRLSKSVRTITNNQPGVTRDRIEAVCSIDERKFILIDTGGWTDETSSSIEAEIAAHVNRAIDEADALLFMVDSSVERTLIDEMLAQRLRKSGKPVCVLLNKSDRKQSQYQHGDYMTFGFDSYCLISAAHGLGFEDVERFIVSLLPQDEISTHDSEPMSLAIVGRPNVGKSSLINFLLQNERVTVHHTPGTTRDPVEIPFTWNKKKFILIDTAGIRRQARYETEVERMSGISAIEKIEKSRLSALMLDANQGVTDGDQRVAGMIVEHYKPAIIVCNKWDVVENRAHARKKLLEEIAFKLKHLDYAPSVFISAITGKGMTKMFTTISQILEKLPIYPEQRLVKSIIKDALISHPPPRYRGRAVNIGPIRVFGGDTPTILIHTPVPSAVSPSYRRYLYNTLREKLPMTHIPLRLLFREKGKHSRKR